MKLVLDEISFRTPFLAAAEQTVAALEAAGETVLGAARRAEVAKQDLDDYKAFKAEVANRLRQGSFSSLPGLRSGMRRLKHCHHLTIGPWRGIFMIDPQGDLVLGLVFSKAPHNYMDRITELLAAKAPAKKDKGEDLA